ncbi:ABC transporter substrate-binding protein [Bacillus suaedae]|uniref:ABC transporter substrate-binding protein n=1 Tax=Halalkalibacter suaedae TaxID=2822140 RepID=A0A940WZ00_9BACI|nr:ABC transporter substrate-binding protein [Bacillus suaedae]MBP3953537.1 ABC transporter substrate-binding protein [Bacillus suaedae]
MVFRKNYLLFCLVFALMVALAACSSDDSTSNNDSNEDTGEETTTREPFKFTYFNGSTTFPNINSADTKLGAMWEEELNTTVDLEYITGDLNTRIGTMVASGQYPDVIEPNEAIDTLLDAEALIPLNDLIDEHAPDLKALYEPYLDSMKAEDGNIYYIPMGANQGFIPPANQDQGAFWIQRAVLKEFDYPEVNTLDEYFELIEKYVEKYPEVDGATTIGYTALTYDWRFFALTNAPMHLAGYPNDGEVIVDMETHEATVYGDKEETKRYLKKLNEINSKGLFDREAFVANYDEYLAKISSGRLLGFFDYGWQTDVAKRVHRDNGDFYKEYMALPIVFDDSITDQYLDPPAFVTNRGVGITTSAENPERIMEFFNHIAKEETQKQIMWGIEGETYEVDEEGMFYRTPEQIEMTADQKWREEFGFTYFEWYWPRGDGVFSDGNAWEPRRQPSVVQETYNDVDKEFLEAYDLEVFTEIFADPQERPWYPTWSANIEQGSDADVFQTKKGDIQRQYFPQLVLADPAEFDAIWDEYVAAFNELDVAGFEEFINQVVQDRLEAAGK